VAHVSVIGAGIRHDLERVPDLTDIVSSLRHDSEILATFARLSPDYRRGPFHGRDLAHKLFDAATEIENVRRDRGQLREQLHAIRSQIDFCCTMLQTIIDASHEGCSCGELGRRTLRLLRQLGYAQ
jgi:hypothetical protein